MKGLTESELEALDSLVKEGDAYAFPDGGEMDLVFQGLQRRGLVRNDPQPSEQGVTHEYEATWLGRLLWSALNLQREGWA